jgi:hypothetical protein
MKVGVEKNLNNKKKGATLIDPSSQNQYWNIGHAQNCPQHYMCTYLLLQR